MHVTQRVDHTRMPASQDHDESSISLQKNRLIIDERIRLRASGVKEERTSCVLEGQNTRNRTGECDSLGDGRGPFDNPDSRRWQIERRSSSGRHSDLPRRSVFGLGIPRGQRLGLQKDIDRPLPAQGDWQATHVVEMPVTEHYRVRLLEPDVQNACIVFQHASLSRVEENSSAIPFDPERKSVFGEQTRAEDRIFDERGYTNGPFHGGVAGCRPGNDLSRNFAVAVAAIRPFWRISPRTLCRIPSEDSIQRNASPAYRPAPANGNGPATPQSPQRTLGKQTICHRSVQKHAGDASVQHSIVTLRSRSTVECGFDNTGLGHPKLQAEAVAVGGAADRAFWMVFRCRRCNESWGSVITDIGSVLKSRPSR